MFTYNIFLSEKFQIKIGNIIHVLLYYKVCKKKPPHHYKHRNITFTNKVLKSWFQSVFGQPMQPLNHFKHEVWEMNRPFLI